MCQLSVDTYTMVYFVAIIYNVVYTVYIPMDYRMEVIIMQAQIRAWGNSQGIRLPKDILLRAGISLNDILDVQVSEGVIKLEKPFRHKSLEERAQLYNGELNLDGEFDWGEPVGREVW